MNKVLILSANQAIQQSLQHLLSRIESIEIEGYFGENLLNFSFSNDCYDLLIVDFSDRKSNTLDTLEHLRGEFPNVPILAMGEYNESEFSHIMLDAGASQYLSINTSGEQIHEAVYNACRQAMN